MREYVLISLPIFICIILISQPAKAQKTTSDSTQTLYDQLQSLFRDDALSFGVLLQSQAEVHWDPQTDGQNTFRIPAARFKVYGNLDDHFSYVFQTDVTGSPAILDANISYTTGRFMFTGGAQKPGISAEFLTPASSTDFINRSRVVSALVNRRDIGLEALVAFTPSLYFTAGMFNGTNQKLENSNNTFYYTGRLVFNPDIGKDNAFRAGLNAAASEENGVKIGNGFLPSINGRRTIYGGDFRLEIHRWLLSSELLLAHLDYGPKISDDVSGFYITAGYWITPKAQVLARLDHLKSDVVHLNGENQLLAGLNYNFTDVTSFQFNYQLNPNEPAFAHHFWLAQFQVAF